LNKPERLSPLSPPTLTFTGRLKESFGKLVSRLPSL
jgi:hypothetical protein